MFRKLLAMIFISILASEAGAQDDELLRRLIDEASANSPILKAAAERVVQARADVRAAASRSAPSIYAGAGAFWNKDAVSSAAIDPLIGAPIAPVPLLSKNVYAAGLAFVQTIYSGGSVGANRRAAEFTLSAAEAESVRSYQAVLSSVRECFHTVRRAAASLVVARQGRDLALEHLKRAQALCDAGVVPLGDVLRVKVAVSQSELDVIRAQNALDISLVALERLVGTKVTYRDVMPEISNDLPDITALLDPSPIAIAEDSIGAAMSDRPELRAYDALRLRAEEMERAARGSRLPNVFVAGELLQTGDSFWPSDRDSWHVQLGLEWHLYDGGRSSALEAKARSAAKELLHKMEDLTGQIRQEVAQAELNITSAQTRLRVALDQIRTAEEDHRMALRRYDARVGTNIDVLDARLALIQSRTQYVDAFCDRAIAHSALLFATGADAISGDITKEGPK